MSQNPPELDRLIERCRNGDEAAWVQLFHEFSGQVARWLARIDYKLREQDLPDLVADVFVKVCRGLSRYSAERGLFRVWLYHQAYGIAIDNIRKRTGQKRIPPNVIVSLEDDPEEGPALVPPAEGALPDEAAAEMDRHHLLFRALEAFGPPECLCRQLISLVYFGGFTYHEAGDALQMKAKTVSSQLSKCLSRLRELWAKLFPGGDFPPGTNY